MKSTTHAHDQHIISAYERGREIGLTALLERSNPSYEWFQKAGRWQVNRLYVDKGAKARFLAGWMSNFPLAEEPTISAVTREMVRTFVDGMKNNNIIESNGHHRGEPVYIHLDPDALDDSAAKRGKTL